MKSKRTRKYRPFRKAYACLPPPDEYNTFSYAQCSLGATAKHDIRHLAAQIRFQRIAIGRKMEDFQAVGKEAARISPRSHPIMKIVSPH